MPRGFGRGYGAFRPAYMPYFGMSGRLFRGSALQLILDILIIMLAAYILITVFFAVALYAVALLILLGIRYFIAGRRYRTYRRW